MQIRDAAVALVFDKDEFCARDCGRQAFDRPMCLSHGLRFRREGHENDRMETKLAKLLVEINQSRPFGKTANLASANVDDNWGCRVRPSDGVQHWAEPRQLLAGIGTRGLRI